MATTAVFVKMILDRWYTSIKNFDALIAILSDETLQKDMVPGKTEASMFWDI